MNGSAADSPAGRPHRVAALAARIGFAGRWTLALVCGAMVYAAVHAIAGGGGATFAGFLAAGMVGGLLSVYRENATTCPHCRQRHKPGASVCHHCGRDI